MKYPGARGTRGASPPRPRGNLAETARETQVSRNSRAPGQSHALTSVDAASAALSVAETEVT